MLCKYTIFMKKILTITLCAAWAFALLGCGAGDSVKGTWEVSDEYVEAETLSYVETFGAEPGAEITEAIKDTTITFDGNGNFTGTGQMEASGIYKINGDSITLNSGVSFTIKDGALYMDSNPYGDIPVFEKQ